MVAVGRSWREAKQQAVHEAGSGASSLVSALAQAALSPISCCWERRETSREVPGWIETMRKIQELGRKKDHGRELESPEELETEIESMRLKGHRDKDRQKK